MTEVYFFDYGSGRDYISGIKSLFKKGGLDHLVPNKGSVAVKMHMGDMGSTGYIRPPLVRTVVDLIKDHGGKPFVTDTSVVYPGGRRTPERYLETAAYNGFVEQTVGAPIIIADENHDTGVRVAIEKRLYQCQMEEAKVASRIYHADVLAVLTHFKGHGIVGMGGSVKNVGMGCVIKETKVVMHKSNPPMYDESKCTMCGTCAEICPENAIVIEDDVLHYDPEKCVFCGSCVADCPENAWDVEGEGNKLVQENVAHSADAVLKGFQGRMFFINFIHEVTPYCDCTIPCGRPLVRDVGIVASTDPVAVDKASFDLVNQAPRFPHPKGKEQPENLFAAIHKTDPLNHIRIAGELGAGSMEYELVKV